LRLLWSTLKGLDVDYFSLLMCCSLACHTGKRSLSARWKPSSFSSLKDWTANGGPWCTRWYFFHLSLAWGQRSCADELVVWLDAGGFCRELPAALSFVLVPCCDRHAPTLDLAASTDDETEKHALPLTDTRPELSAHPSEELKHEGCQFVCTLQALTLSHETACNPRRFDARPLQAVSIDHQLGFCICHS